jgi:hypothetical protein
MTASPLAPRLLRGALVAVDTAVPVPRVIVFQYNPDTLTRTLAQTGGAAGGERSEVLRLKGAPVETIRLDVEIDATDQLERRDEKARQLGIYPQLSALEMLLYPPSVTVIVNAALAAAGMIEIAAAEAPMTLLVWGPKRVLPVRVADFSITEEAHDVALNPIRARVSLTLRVLSYNDLLPGSPGFGLFLGHQLVKETMAAVASVADIGAIARGGLAST